MSLAVEYRVSGMEHPLMVLRALPLEFKKKAFRDVVRSAANVLRDTAARMAPTGEVYHVGGIKGDRLVHQPGALARSLSVTFRKARGQTTDPYTVVAHVRTRSGGQWFPKSAYYSHMVEFGTKDMTKRPFMIPAAQASKGPAFHAAVIQARRSWRRVMRKYKVIGRRAFKNLETFVP